ncbi:vegetative incompatibility protein HET-E-1 [Podospora conica]|nr:vegetative incompatibility protein HET-E-1 [Schizothecium conicum]
MRLLNVTTLEVDSFDGPKVPPYAILSHVWGQDEVTMADMEIIARHRLRRQQELARILPRAGGNPDKADTMKMLLISSMLMAFRGGHSSHYRRDHSSLHGAVAHSVRHADAYEKSSLVPASLHSSHALELKAGFTKISYACGQAARDGYQYLWVDTCCIDKSSSAELSESLNSLYAWYRDAAVCYVYLADVHQTSNPARGGYRSWKDALAASAYFTRGWTLPELLAPRNLLFFSHTWHPLGTRAALAPTISRATLIPRATLVDPSLVARASLARRMSWAARRTTTRPEDAAYSLLGLFPGVHLTPYYGEGLESAFLRLQRKILARSDDQSLFAWGLTSTAPNKTRHLPSDGTEIIGDDEDDALTGLLPFLARRPSDFLGAEHVVVAPPFRSPPPPAAPHSWTNKGVGVTLTMIHIGQGHHAAAQKYFLAPLACRDEREDPGDRLGVMLATTETANVFVRTKTVAHTRVSGEELEATTAKDDRAVFVVSGEQGGMWGREQQGGEEAVFVRAGDLVGPGYEVCEVRGRRAEWNREFGTLRVLGPTPGGEEGGVYQLAVLVFFQRHLECGFVVRVLVDEGDGEVFVDLVPPPAVAEEEKKVEDAVLNALRAQAKGMWERPGRFALEKTVVKAGKETKVMKVVDVANPDGAEAAEEDDGQHGARIAGGGEVQSPRAAVLFVEKWETEYRRVVHATAERKKKGVLALEMSSMLYAGA